LAILANGYVDHEAAHIRFTDFAVEKPPGLAGEILNLLEDIRIEHALGARYPGSRHNLARLAAYLEERDPSMLAQDTPVAEQVFAALYALLRLRVLGQTSLEPGACALEHRLDELLPPGVVTKLLALAFEVRKTTSTAEVLALALRIVAMLHEEAAQPPPPEGQGGAGQNSEGTPESAPSPSVGVATSAPQPEAGKDAAPGDAKASGSSPADGRSIAEPVTPTGGGKTRSPTEQQAALQALLTSGSGTAPDTGEKARTLLNSVARRDRTRVQLAELDRLPPNRDAPRCRSEARAATAALRRRLTALVQSSRTEDRWCARRGRLDTRQLYRVGMNDPRVFERRAEHPAPNTAVALLLDRSGSMSAVIGLANQAVLATLLALEEIEGVSSWAAAFPSTKPNKIVPLKSFEERARRVAGRFQIGAHGGTPLASALWRAAWELCQREEPRRLLIVATDALPQNVPACLDLIERARASQIEVLGLGIGMTLEAVSQVFGSRDAVAIKSIHELAPALFKVLERPLIAA
ncbi:MAG: hypothetical protein KDI22_03620, partial [Gammaproteobacteria bacterium]|nr:hypothetical protein [Gammaproteobacteria bacterium]